MTFNIDHSLEESLDSLPGTKITWALQLGCGYGIYLRFTYFLESRSNLLTVHRKNALALSSPDKSLITKGLVVLFSFQERALIARIVRQVIIDALD